MEVDERLSGSSHFGALLRQHRLAAGLSQETLAERAQMSEDGVSALERGRRRTPQRETLELLARALALDVEQRREFEAAAAAPSVPRRRGCVTVGPWPEAGVASLPFALTSFVGRKTELGDIARLVRRHRLVTLTGSGGVGKTQTALQVASALRDDSRIYFIGLAPLTDASLVANAIASSLGVQEVPNRPLLGTLIAYLKNKALLLILDNCEHVIGEAASVAYTLLLNCPNLRILATSREALRAAGERAYRLPSLSVTESVELFTDRARAADDRFTLSEEEAAVVAELCRHLDCIPLAIEMAAARTQTLTPRAMLAMLERQFALLRGGDRAAPSRQQTMHATIDWSYELLPAPEQRVFERLSIFAGSCTLAEATVVCADKEAPVDAILDLLSLLADKSLVVVDLAGTEPRYRLLEAFRQHAREKLVARGEQQLIAHRHTLAYLALAERFERAYYYDLDDVSRAMGRAELDNWRAALQWTLIGPGDIVLGQRIVAQLRELWANFAPLEGRRWLRPAFDFIDARTPPEVRGRLHLAAGKIALVLQEFEEAKSCSLRALPLCRTAGDLLGVARAEQSVACALEFLGEIDEARKLQDETLPLVRSLGSRRLMATTLTRLGYLSALRSDLAVAHGFLAKAQQAAEAYADKNLLWLALALSWVDFLAGDAELALQKARAAVTVHRGAVPEPAIADSLDDVTMYLIFLSRYDEADEVAREMLDLALAHHLDAVAANALQHLAEIQALRPPALPERATASLAKAARVIGFVDARLSALGSRRSYVQQPLYDRVITVVRSALGADAVAGLLADGAAMTEGQAVGQVMSLR
jgi:predicted ATPase/transcriptional regulator with XRE-family HTH domain